MKQLKHLTKEDLIKVIANITDKCGLHSYSDFCNNGFEPIESHSLSKIGDMCIKECVNNNNWELPNIIGKYDNDGNYIGDK